MLDEHVMKARGRAKVVVKSGKVVEIGEPLITSCPLLASWQVRNAR
ncbi:MAG: DUF2099 family protein [Candidatus Verstraetearchaeota archaeon]|nr:DUF2099 family protein [Candidatus Verstraetearchaeota archaeon]NHW44291.1 DUF2099 family protein [Candidatus Verstraetearchaeota archaeon]